MRKVLSILLAAVLLVSCGATALAAEEAPARSYTVSDISFIAGTQYIELTGMTAVLDVANVDGNRACRLQVNQDGTVLGEMTFTIQPDGLCVLHMDSSTLGVKDYGIDMKAILSRSIKSGIDKVVETLQGLDTDGMAQSIISGLLQERPAPEAPVEAEAPAAPAAPKATLGIDAEGIIDVLSECVTSETTQMGGDEYGADGSVTSLPDGEYEVTSITVDTDAICRMLDCITLNGESAGMGDAIRNAGTDISFSIVGMAGETANIGQVNLSVSGDQTNLTVGGGYNRLDTDESTQTTWSLGVSSGADPETMSVNGATLTITATDSDGSFAPAPVDTGALIMLSDMQAEEAQNEISQAFATLLTDMLAPLAAEAPAE